MSSLSVDDIISYAIKNHSKYAAICDLNNMYGAMEFYNKATAAGLKPVIGLHVEYQNQPLFLFAKDYAGYQSLIKISSLVMTCLTDTTLSVDQISLKLEKVQKQIPNYINNHLYVLTEDINTLPLSINKANYFSLNQKANHPIAAKLSCYEKDEDLEIVKSLYAIGQGVLLKDLADYHKFDNQSLVDEKQASKLFSDEALKNLQEVLNNIDLKIEFSTENSIFDYSKISHKDSRLLLQGQCKEGLKRLGLVKDGKTPERYAKRLGYEVDVITKMGFANYFLIVQDYVNFAKDHGILVGPGRGSAAGSLVSYLLGITSVDPIKNNLIFERFLNPERSTMPDIDIDFMDSRRNEVVEHLYERYGKEHVAHIITYQRLKSKMAIRDVGRILNISLPEVNKKSSIVVDDESLTTNQTQLIKQAFNEYPQWFRIASKIINFPRQYGLHAAGVVLSNNNLDEVVPVQNSTDGILCTQFSMEYLEPLGLIKMDLLGLVNLTSLDLILKRIQKDKGKKINLSDIDLNDQKVFKYLGEGNTVGIFQLESKGMTHLLQRIQPKNIEDISICSALFRPGPQKNIDTYLENRKHPEKIKYLNNDVRSILEPTYNILIYQEQIIQLVQKVAGFSLAQADLFRRAISKKKVDKLKELQKSFIDGCLKQGYQQQLAEKIFDTIFQFANYGFNHSHSLAYSYISYWLAYLAYYYPVQFFTVLLSTFNPNSKDINDYLGQIKKLGIKIHQPDINLSDITFDSNKDEIIFGFDSIKGVGHNSAIKIIEARNKTKGQKFDSLMHAIKVISNNGAVGQSLLMNLAYSGCFDDLGAKEGHSRFWIVNNLEALFLNCNNIGIDGKMITAIRFNDAQPTEKDLDQLNQKQMELIGTNLVVDPIVKVKDQYTGQWTLSTLKEITSDPDMSKFFHCLVRLTSIREITTKTNKKMCFIKVADETQACSGVCFPGAYAECHQYLQKNKYLILTGKKDQNKTESIVISNVRLADDYLK